MHLGPKNRFFFLWDQTVYWIAECLQIIYKVITWGSFLYVFDEDSKNWKTFEQREDKDIHQLFIISLVGLVSFWASLSTILNYNTEIIIRYHKLKQI